MNVAEAAGILNVRHDADPLVVKAAWHALTKRHHPDRGGDAEIMRRVNAAYEYLHARTPQALSMEWERLSVKQSPPASPPPPASPSPPGYIHPAVHRAEMDAAVDAANERWARIFNELATTHETAAEVRFREQTRNEWRPVRKLITLTWRLTGAVTLFFVYGAAIVWVDKNIGGFLEFIMATAGFFMTIIFIARLMRGGWKNILHDDAGAF